MREVTVNSAIAIGMTLLLGVFNCWTSRINALFFFGRTVDQELRDSVAGREITRSYLTRIVLATATATWLAWMGGYLGHGWLGATGFLLELVAFSLIFARANAQVRELAQGRPSVTRKTVQVALLAQPTYWVPGLMAILLPLALCVAALGLAILPASRGMGLSAGWSAWSNSLDRLGDSFLFGMASGMLAASVALLLLFRTSVRLRTKMAQYTVRSSFALEWIATVMLVATLVSNFLGIRLSREFGKGVMFVAFAAAVGTMLWNQWRYKTLVPPPVELGADDRWRWGLFYVDRADPALFVQSRCGAGYTLNYGRVAAWPITMGAVAYVVGVLFFLPRYHW